MLVIFIVVELVQFIEVADGNYITSIYNFQIKFLQGQRCLLLTHSYKGIHENIIYCTS